jgi:serine/threonine protein kinase
MCLSQLARVFQYVECSRSTAIGCGVFATTYAGVGKPMSGDADAIEVPVAASCFERSSKDASDGCRYLDQVEVIVRIHHPACLSILAFDAPSSGPFGIVTEIMSSDGQVLLRVSRCAWRSPDSNQTKTSIITRGIAAGIGSLHSQRLIHRDLKPSHVLLDENFYPRIGGFGVAKLLPPGTPSGMDDCGAPSYGHTAL